MHRKNHYYALRMHGHSWDFRDASMYLDVANADVTDVLKDRGFRFYKLENLHSEDCPIRLVQCIPCGEVVQQYQMMSHACLNQRRCCFVNDVHGVSMVQSPCPCQFTMTRCSGVGGAKASPKQRCISRNCKFDLQVRSDLKRFYGPSQENK